MAPLWKRENKPPGFWLFGDNNVIELPSTAGHWTSLRTLNKWPNLSEPLFSYLKNGANGYPLLHKTIKCSANLYKTPGMYVLKGYDYCEYILTVDIL